MAEARNKWKVSIWVGQEKLGRTVDILRDQCGIKRYDPDSQEIIVDDINWSKQPVGDMLRMLSYSETFFDDAILAANRLGIDTALYVVAQFEMAYSPAKVKGKIAQDPVFIGVFDWNDESDEN